MVKTKVLIGAAIAGSFLLGTVFHSYMRPGVSDAFNAPQVTAPAPAQQLAAPRTAAPRVTQPTAAYTQPAQTTTVKKRRSWEREALIIAGSSGAGAAIGGIAGGGKGAAIGAASGAVAGTVYDITTRDK